LDIKLVRIRSYVSTQASDEHFIEIGIKAMKSAMILNVHALEQEGLPTTPFNDRSALPPSLRTCHVISKPHKKPRGHTRIAEYPFQYNFARGPPSYGI
jgi:hypothetical protein